MAAVLWRPSPDRAASSAMAALAARAGLPPDYDALYAWSIAEPGAFWRAVWELGEVTGEPGAVAFVPGGSMLDARWFPDAELSFAENLLRRDAGTAVVYRREDGLRRELSFAELRDRVARTRAAFRALGLRRGDRVASMLPNTPEAVVALLACNSLGAIWASCSPDFGAQGALDRFAQIEPALLLVPAAHRYRGRRHGFAPKLAALRAGLAGARVVEVAEDGACPELAAAEPDFAHDRVPFAHPLYVLFSSGTTGRPKCIVHGAGGTLLQHLKEHRLHTDLRAGERLFFFTTTGWMMWNWLVSGLASGATIVLYDGDPLWPDRDALWRLAEEERVDVFGVSAKFVDACRTAGLRPRETHDLTRVRTLLSTGSPLLPEAFDWIHDAALPHAQIASISGGTDIVSCFALGCPLLPVRRGEIQCRGLGMAVDVFDAAGRPVRGEPGELVCTRPFPSMPVGFWNDPDGARYRAAYFEQFAGVWRHGDWAELLPSGGLVITGRSDATLNPGGVRIGTAEIYRQLDTVPEIEDAVVVGREVGADQEVALFVVLRAGEVLDDAMRQRIRAAIRDGASPRHVPALVEAVPDIPRTRSGKVSELAVKAALHGRALDNRDALANPESLAAFARFAVGG